MDGPPTTNYVPFQEFLQQFQPSPNQVAFPSNLVATAPEFVPRQESGTNANEEQSAAQGAIRKNGGPRNGYHHNRRPTSGRGGDNSYRNGSRNYNNHHQNNYNNQNRQNRGGGQPPRMGGNNYRESEFHNNRNQQQQQQPAQQERQQEKENMPNRRWPKRRFDYSSKKNSKPVETKCQRDKLIREITSNTLECLVCCEKIKDHHSTWSCSTCFTILHLKCVTKWALSSKSDEGDWRCPACQTPKTKVPHDYYCFCGKQRNPGLNRVDTAHSCGEVCGNPCENGHSCTILCHPGPHPACQATIQRSCYCGKVQKMLQCSQKDEIKCNSPCGKLLNCKLHECEEPCHAGECQECSKTMEISCFCAKNPKIVACNIDNKVFSCDSLCSKPLECGDHKCQASCHEGPCKPCSLLPENITSCPCGKQQITRGERKSCLDEIPTCKAVCKKILKCGQPSAPHQCTAKCHTGDCPTCNKKTMVKCRCGNMDHEIKCKQLTTRADDARCKKKCNKMKSCLRHKCQELCCIDFDHVCRQNCNKTLSCGKHKCTLSCHRGNCLPCDRVSFDELNCECGAAVIYPPIPCGTKRPPCERPCSRSHPCDHEVLHPCHTDQRCPPCVIFTTKSCYGEHEQRKTIPCHEASFCCGRPCGKSLTGCDHKCNKVCHTGDCMNRDETCRQKCQTPRLDCPHVCGQLCHCGRDCPDTNCRESVEVQCACGNLKKMRACFDFTSEFKRFANAQLASTMQEMQNGNAISLSDIMGGNKISKSNKVLECNDECRLIERNKRLEMALGPIDPSKVQMPTYSDFLKTFARKDPQLIRSVHEKLTNLVNLAKESKQKSRSHSFPVMNREKRQMIHEMCEAFGISSQAYDAEPNRNVVATAIREMCYCPSMSIMDVIQREAGQRVRLPIPQNAWKTPPK